jgi:hypothetical protein
MRSADSYQSIKGPDELEEESRYESILQSLLEEYDPDEGDFKAYQSWCRKRARELASESMEEEEND